VVKKMSDMPGTLPAAEGNAQSDPLDELPVAYVEMDAHGAITRANPPDAVPSFQPCR
jgi:hypothetical protein